MKKLDFSQMEVINGGACVKEGAIFLGSAILSLGTTGFTAGLSWGLTAVAYVDYFNCQMTQMPTAVYNNVQSSTNSVTLLQK